MMVPVLGVKVLITMNQWFVAPDGKQYRAIFGTVKDKAVDNDKWQIEVGRMLVREDNTSCLIFTDKVNPEKAEGWTSDAANGIRIYATPSHIYMADEPYVG